MAELALAVVGAVDVCIRSAHEVKEICQRFRAHDREIEEKTVLVDAIWIRIESQMRFLSKISESLEKELARSQLNLLHILEGKLRQAITQLALENSVNDMNDRSPKQRITDFLKKWKWAIKNSLRELVIELEAWQSRFDPTWYLMILNSNKIMDLELRQANRELANEPNMQMDFLKNQLNPLTNMWKLRSATHPDYRARLYLEWATLENSKDIPIMFSTARAIIRENGGQTRLYVSEAVTSPDGSHGPLDFTKIKADVESLAGILQQIDPSTFGLLSCRGLVRHRESATKAVNGVELLYGTPQNSAVPASLRGLLLDRSFGASLNSLMRIAKQLIRSVSFVHTSGFVHKNIRPENILVFPSRDSLLGMNQPLGDPAWYRNLYRHPERQGTNVMNRYVMQHDIYSLGVCLLEIGLWQSFVHYPGLNPTAAPVTPASSEIQICDADFEAAHLSTRLRTKEQLVGMAKRKLPSRCGDVYTEVVTSCLECLDPRNEMFGDANQEDKDGILVGIRFIEQILARINGISI
ncbi:hypothetical protein BU16DRAFT_571221 [Lophium mytilinum]|uniref:Protein kinase domain-containing protein n=1 Tax=Lophium mytilinum TaxID=390894 RepID=A0A6A6R2Q1_9PEZI|nr:hypothetical protein BU16DRAFT_571221 [Lophium mytilinum]